jgi:hypothetical protein
MFAVLGRRFLVLLTSFTLVLFVASCNKGEKASQGLLDSVSAQRVPGQAIAFLTWDSSRPAYTAFRQTAWGSSGNVALLDSVRKLGEQSKLAEVEKLVEIFIKSGVLTTSAGEPEVIRDGAAFLTLATGNSKPSFAVYAHSDQNSNLKDKLTAIESLLKSEGFTPQKRSQAPEGFSVSIGGEQPITLHFAAVIDALAISSSEELLAGGFAQPKGEAVNQLRQDPALQSTLASLPSAESQFSFAYVKIDQLVQTIKASLPQTEQTKSTHEILAASPAKALVLSRHMSSSLSDAIRLTLLPQTEDQKRWIDALSGSGKLFSFQKLPGDVLIGLTIDGKLLENLKNTALSEASAEMKQALEAQLRMFDGLESFSIALRSGSAGSPFPELVLAATGTSVDAIASGFKTGVEQIVGSMNLNLGSWQKKEVEKSNCEYLMSPLGIGAFLAKAPGSVVLASTEASVAEVLKAQQGKSPSLESNLPKGARDLLKSGASLGFSYANFHRIGSLIEQVQGSLALFTGGQGGADASQIKQLKDMGVVASRLSRNGETLAVDLNYEQGQP